MGKAAALAKEYPLDVRFIEMMPIGLGKAYQGSMQEVIQKEPEKYIWCSKAGFRGSAWKWSGSILGVSGVSGKDWIYQCDLP